MCTGSLGRGNIVHGKSARGRFFHCVLITNVFTSPPPLAELPCASLIITLS